MGRAPKKDLIQETNHSNISLDSRSIAFLTIQCYEKEQIKNQDH